MLIFSIIVMCSYLYLLCLFYRVLNKTYFKLQPPSPPGFYGHDIKIMLYRCKGKFTTLSNIYGEAYLFVIFFATLVVYRALLLI